MAQIGVVGLGNWGTALANHLALKGFDVVGWCKEPEIAVGINSTHSNPLYLSNVQLHEKFRATNTLRDATNNDIVVVAVPSHVLGSVVPQLKISPKSIIVSAIKGLEEKSLLTPLQFMAQYLPKGTGMAVLSGPSFAKDVAARRPAGVVAASVDEAVARRVAELFASDWMKVYISVDPLGVELGGTVKNVIALAAGVSDGLELGDSARAGLITRGLAEMMRLAAAMGADVQTLSGLSGLGDLVMTASCDSSRNRTVGLRLGRGESLTNIVNTLGSVAEGVSTTPLVMKLAEKYNVDMPITVGVSKLLNGQFSAAEMAKWLLSRPPRREF